MAFTAAAVGLVAFTTSSVHAEAGYVMASSNPPCTSQIYCSGPLLDTVQRARLFNDSKTFVDMPTRRGQYEVLSAFDQLGTNATQEDVANFVAENFDSPDGELALVEDLPEWQADPPVLSQIADPHLSIWAKSLNFIWTKLYRISKPHQICNECLSSSITVQRGFIVPGGRFREFYYWDTYWIVLGLLASDLHQIAIDMVENMLDVVETFGFFPNGGRIYYLNRSQPPMLTAMVREVVAATDNVALLRRALPILEMEHDWWMSNRIVAPTFFPNGTLVPTLNATDPGSVDSRFALNAFVVAWEHPRPESYMEDVATTQVFANDTLRRKQAYRDIAAGAESGWDFSTRWLNTTLPDGTHNAAGAQLTDIITSDILPVDLNSILYDMEMTMANFHGRVGTPAGQQYFSHAASRRAEAMDLFLFDPATACWNDARLSTGEQNAEWYPSNVHPMWTGAHGTLSAPFARNGTLCPKLLRDVETYHTGLPSSEVNNTAMQWDFPNVWAPIQHYAVLGLLNNGQRDAAVKLAQQYIDTAFCAWEETGGSENTRQTPLADLRGDMFEKFDARSLGRHGFGGEYKVQTGFGWSNAVALDLMRRFGDELAAPQCTEPGAQGATNSARASTGHATGSLAVATAAVAAVFMALAF